MSLKPLQWLGDSLDRLRQAPEQLRSDAGYQLSMVQQGQFPSDFKPTPDLGSGVVEIRLNGEHEFRVF